MPASVWIAQCDQKSFSSSVANATSNVAVSPGESRAETNSRATRWNRRESGLMIFTVCGRVSALRTVTSAVYTSFASASRNVTAGGNTRSHGSGFVPSAVVLFVRPRNRSDAISGVPMRRRPRSTRQTEVFATTQGEDARARARNRTRDARTETRTRPPSRDAPSLRDDGPAPVRRCPRL